MSLHLNVVIDQNEEYILVTNISAKQRLKCLKLIKQKSSYITFWLTYINITDLQDNCKQKITLETLDFVTFNNCI